MKGLVHRSSFAAVAVAAVHDVTSFHLEMNDRPSGDRVSHGVEEEEEVDTDAAGVDDEGKKENRANKHRSTKIRRRSEENLDLETTKHDDD